MRMLTGTAAFALIAMTVPAPVLAQADTAQEAVVTSMSQLTSTSHASDGMERSRDGNPIFVGPMGGQAVSYNGYQYAVFYSGRDRTIPREEASSRVVIARRPLGSTNWEYSILRDYLITSDDAHNRQTIAVSEGDGRIHISFDHHNRRTLNYAATAAGVADDPANVVWDNSVFTYAENLGGDPQTRLDVTYPLFAPFPGGGLIIYFRSGGSVGGEMRLAHYDAETGTWGEVRNISSRWGTFNGEETARGPYIASGMQIGGDGSLHASWIFRERSCDYTTSSRSEIFCNHGLFYARSHDEGVTWVRADGSLIADTEAGETISIDNIGGPVVEVPQGLGPSNPSIGSTVDRTTGEVHVLLRHLPSPGAASGPAYFHYLGLPDGTWTQRETDFDGNNARLGIVGDRLYAFVGRDRGEIYFAERGDNFQAWQKLEIKLENGRDFNPRRGFISWDMSMLETGQVSLLWHREPEERGLNSALQVFDIALR